MTGRKVFRVVVACLLALLIGACSQSSKTADNAGPSVDPAKNVQYGPLGPAPIVDVTTSPSSEPFAKVDYPPPAPKPTECPGDVQGGGTSQIPANASYISAAVDPYRPWTYKGSYCPGLVPGADCWIPFQGSWRLFETATGSIVFQAFENGATTPVRSPELGPVPSAGSFNQSTRFHYIPGKNARTVTFRALLRDATGQVVAHSDPQTLPIPGCAQR